MNKPLMMLLLALALAGCASKPAVPAWKTDAGSALKGYSDAYLKGDTALAQTEFMRARSELSSTGRPDLVAHAELYRCATRVASIEFDPCPGFVAVAQDATLAEHAYARYLAGDATATDLPLLPEQHRAMVQGKAALASVADPLSRLVAAGVLMRTARVTPLDIAVATDTASEQGWRRPLLMWLGVSLARARAAGDAAVAARIERRIALAGAAAGQRPLDGSPNSGLSR